MTVRLEVHLEVDDERQFVWWASAPTVPGFYAAADHLHPLLDQAAAALRELLDDPAVVIDPVVVNSDDRTAGDTDVERSTTRTVAALVS